MVHIVASLISGMLLIGSAWLVLAMIDEKRGAIAAALGMDMTPDRVAARRRIRIRSVAPASVVDRPVVARRLAA